MAQLAMAATTTTKQPLPLNAEQQAAADDFFEFLFNDAKEMGISGPGGTGKTFLMGHMIDEIMPRYFRTCKMMGIEPKFDTVHMTATTNKAAEQLSMASGRDCETVHSFLNLIIKDDYKTGQSNLTRGKKWHIHERIILFIDECSMIDRKLDQHIQGTLLNCKIVYVGDHCQLAPVQETLSPIYRRGVPFAHLRKPERTSVPELQALNMQLRDTVETGEFKPIQLVPGIIDLLDDAQMQAELDAHFASQSHSDRICAFTNERVMAYNDHIRTQRQLPDEYVVGERLVNNTPCHLKGAILSVESEVEILALSDPQIVEIEEDIRLVIQRAKLQTGIGTVHEDVPLPIDRQYFSDLLKFYARAKKWDIYYPLRNLYADLRPRDASTVHKAQGSSFDTTFVDLGNISTCHNPQQVARMLYVACSRARHRIAFYGNLAAKYGGVIG